MLLGQVMLNALGTTVTMKPQLVDWPQESLAVHVMTVLPIGKVLPLGGAQLVTIGQQPPLTVGA